MAASATPPLVNWRDVLVVRADVEHGVKILRHRADVPRGRINLVTPFADGQLQDFVQDLRRTHPREILFEVAVTAVVYRAINTNAGGGHMQHKGRRRGADSTDEQ